MLPQLFAFYEGPFALAHSVLMFNCAQVLFRKIKAVEGGRNLDSGVIYDHGLPVGERFDS